MQSSFSQHTKLAMLGLLPNLYSSSKFQLDLNQFILVNVKLEINGYVINYNSRIKFLLDELIFNGTAKTKLVMLAFLYCGEFVKTLL